METAQEAWNRFCREATLDNYDEEKQTNLKYSFKKLTSKYGKAYIEYVRTAWAINGGALTKEEFMKINGDMPESFFNKITKDVKAAQPIATRNHKTGTIKLTKV